MVRYCGWYSNRAWGERRKHGLLRPGDEPEEEREAILDVADYRPEPVPSKTWRQLIQKVGRSTRSRAPVRRDDADHRAEEPTYAIH